LCKKGGKEGSSLKCEEKEEALRGSRNGTCDKHTVASKIRSSKFAPSYIEGSPH
jgi:hypothetical protein